MNGAEMADTASEKGVQPTGLVSSTWSFGGNAMIRATGTADYLMVNPPSEEVRQYTEWASQLSYKPGWRFTIQGGANVTGIRSWSKIVIHAETMDSNSEKPISLDHYFDLPYCHDQREFNHVVLELIYGIEQHEAMEFFKSAGERVRNPHPAPYRVLYS